VLAIGVVGAGRLDQHVPGGHVRVGDDLGRREAGPGGQAGGTKGGGGLELGHRGGPRLDGGADLADVVDPPGRRCEAGVVVPGRLTDHLGQHGEVLGSDALEDEPAVGRRERVDDGLDLVLDLPVDAHRPQVGDDVRHGHHGVEHGHVDLLALAGAVAVPQGGQHADGPEQGRTDVAEGADRVGPGAAARLALVLVDAGHGLDDRGVRRPVAVRRLDRVPEARQRQVDRRRVPLGDHVIAEAEAVHRPRLEVLADDVEAGDQRQEQLAALGSLEVDGHAALVEVVAQERGAHRAAVGVDHVRERPPARLARPGVLDLDHVGAEAGQELGGVGQRLHLLGGQDAHAVEGPPVRGCVAVDHVSELHDRRVRRNVTVRQVRPTEKCDDPSDLAVAWSPWPPGGS
jgi:hypothetical protein